MRICWSVKASASLFLTFWLGLFYNVLRTSISFTSSLDYARKFIDISLFVSAAKAPDLHSSNKQYYSGALKFHKKCYSTFPPHDTRLYDVLQLRPNATLADISRNYRRACRRYHPDKNQNSDTGKLWEEVQQAHDILKTEETRLLYHKYGFIQNTTCSSIATFLKLSGSSGNSIKVNDLQNDGRQKANDIYPRWTLEQLSLLELMGYDPRILSPHSKENNYNFLDDDRYRNRSEEITTHDRVVYMARQLVETIRPLVEGSVSQEMFTQNIATTMNQLKRAPLGAPMIRCIGRAYRHSGQRILEYYHHNKKKHDYCKKSIPKKTSLFAESQIGISNKIVLPITFTVQNHWRGTKQLLTAAMASSKFILQDHKIQKHKKKIEKKKRSKEKKPPKFIKFPELGSLNDEKEEDDEYIPWVENNDYDDFISIHEDDDGDEMANDEEAQQSLALLKSLQIEALWSITKIEIDRIVQKACNTILRGQFYFFQPQQFSSSSSSQGWVGATGEIIHTDVGRLRAAAAMVLLGDIMVNCSKENTSWVE